MARASGAWNREATLTAPAPKERPMTVAPLATTPRPLPPKRPRPARRPVHRCAGDSSRPGYHAHDRARGALPAPGTRHPGDASLTVRLRPVPVRTVRRVVTPMVRVLVRRSPVNSVRSDEAAVSSPLRAPRGGLDRSHHPRHGWPGRDNACARSSPFPSLVTPLAPHTASPCVVLTDRATHRPLTHRSSAPLPPCHAPLLPA